MRLAAALLNRLDETLARIRATGRPGRSLRRGAHSCAAPATEYFHQNCWIGVSQPGPTTPRPAYELGLDRFMWG